MSGPYVTFRSSGVKCLPVPRRFDRHCRLVWLQQCPIGSASLHHQAFVRVSWAIRKRDRTCRECSCDGVCLWIFFFEAVEWATFLRIMLGAIRVKGILVREN